MTAPLLPPFPVDDMTLHMLELAITAPEGDTRSSVAELCSLYAELVAGPNFPIEYHPHDIITALVAEVRRLRAP